MKLILVFAHSEVINLIVADAVASSMYSPWDKCVLSSIACVTTVEVLRGYQIVVALNQQAYTKFKD